MALDLTLAIATHRAESPAPVVLATITGDGDRGATGAWIDPPAPVTLRAALDAGAEVELVVSSRAPAILELRAGTTVRSVPANAEITSVRLALGEAAEALVLTARGGPVFAGNLRVLRSPGRVPPPSSAPPSLVILISCDTLRADALSAYGEPRLGTPHLDRLARRSRLSSKAYANSPWTLPSHMTMLTGLLPGEHRVKADRALPGGFTTLAERLSSAGVEAAGFATKVAWLDAKFGFARGFAPWIVAWEEAPATLDRALLWLEADHPRPAFLFLHLYDAHSDATARIYDAPPPFRSLLLTGEPRLQARRPGAPGSRALQEENEALARPSTARLRVEDVDADAREIHDAYREGVLALDHALGAFLRGLAARGLLDRATIVLTADHGEEFVEHGQLLHGQLHEEVVHVPLLVRDGTTPGIDAEPRSLADVAAIVEMAARIEGAAIPERPIFGYGPAGLRSVRDGRWLYLSRLGSEAESLFDLDADPGESTAVHMQHAAAASELREIEKSQQRRNDVRHRAARTTKAPQPPGITAEERERLGALGYVGD